jgi:ABC-type multidrug transport system ATPase subunit
MFLSKWNPGEIAVLTGVNGVGKTTLLTSIAGMKSAAKGNVSVWDVGADSIRTKNATRCSVYLPNEAWLPSNIPLQEYLAAAGSLFEVDIADLPNRIDALLNLLRFGSPETSQ